VKYAAIADWATDKAYPVTFMCDQLGVVRQGSDLRKLPSDGGGELRLRQRAGLRKGFNCGRPGRRPQVIIGTLGRACRGSSARPRVAHAERSPNLLSEA
jgi:hypothetical protein